MNWLPIPKFLRDYFYQRHLNANRSLQHAEMSFEKAKTFGILVDLDQKMALDNAKQYIDKLSKSNKKAEILAYKKRIENKNGVAQNLDFGAGYSVNLFTSEDVNWYKKPNHSSVEQFSKKNFDVLINADLQQNQSLEYISAVSNATCRVGCYIEDQTVNYELMIQMNGSIESHKFFDQIDRYLKMIKS